MRQTFGEDSDLVSSVTAPALAGDGTNLVTSFRTAMRAAKFMLTVVVGGTGSVSGLALWGYSPRNTGRWGIHHDDGPLAGAGAIAAGSAHHFVLKDVGGYTRAQLVYVEVAGAPTVTAFLTEILDGPTSVGD